jgi:hypothetical protein
MAHRAFRVRLSAAGASRRSSEQACAVRASKYSAISDAGAVLPGTRTLRGGGLSAAAAHPEPALGAD